MAFLIKKTIAYSMLGSICEIKKGKFNIRAFELKDTAPFYRLVKKNKSRLSLYFPISMGYLTNEKRARIYVENKIDLALSRNQMAYLLEWESTKELIGFIVAKNFNWKKRECEFAYWIDEDFQGLGLTTAAINTLKEYALEEWGIETVFLRIDGINEGSRRVAQKCGFDLEYISEKEFDRGDGQKIDVEYWYLRK